MNDAKNCGEWGVNCDVQEMEKYMSLENYHPHICHDTLNESLNPGVSAAILVFCAC